MMMPEPGSEEHDIISQFVDIWLARTEAGRRLSFMEDARSMILGLLEKDLLTFRLDRDGFSIDVPEEVMDLIMTETEKGGVK